MSDVTIVRYPLRPRLLEVSRVRRITPSTVRVTLTGDELEGFREAAPADHVKLCFPEPGAELPSMPRLGPDGLEPPPPGSPGRSSATTPSVTTARGSGRSTWTW